MITVNLFQLIMPPKAKQPKEVDNVTVENFQKLLESKSLSLFHQEARLADAKEYIPKIKNQKLLLMH